MLKDVGPVVVFVCWCVPLVLSESRSVIQDHGIEKELDESTLSKLSFVPVMHHDLSDLA